MIIISKLPSLFFLITTFPHAILALKNVTISHNSSSIDYKPNSSAWFSSESELDFSGSHITTETKGASASFSFTGVAIYYAAASWPYPVSANISLNGGSGTFVDLHDYQSTQANGGSASASATIHWYRTGFRNQSHTIVVSLANNATYAVLDTFIYTIDDGSNTTDNSSAWPIILGGVLGGIILICAIVGMVFVYRRRQKKHQKPNWDEPILENLMTPLVTPSAAETHPLVSSDFDNSHTNYPPNSSGIHSQAFDSSQYGRYSNYISTPQPHFVEGSSSSSSGLHVMAEYLDEKKVLKSEVVLSVANPGTDELPPPAYSEHHES